MFRNKLFFFGLCVTSIGCGVENAGGDVGDNTPGGSVNVSQGGAQDIAEFRSLVEEGKVPTLDTLDPVGFFAEHALDMPDADCGKDICIHPSLAVAPRFNGGNWTMAFVSMNTAVDPSTLERPPVHLAIAIEKSSFTGIVKSGLDSDFDAALSGLFASLRPEDRVTLITFGEKATRHIHLAEPTSEALTKFLYESNLAGDGLASVSLYDGIAATSKAFDDGVVAGFQGSHRVLLLTSGHTTTGITDPDNILALGEALVEEGTAFGVIGVGEEYDNALPAALGSMGAGTYAYAKDSLDLANLLQEEGKTTLFPLATEFDLQILPAKGYRVGRIYGTRRATANAAGATLSMPALFIGQRDGATDVGGSRRGGGGGLFVELLPDAASLGGIGANEPAFQIKANWSSAGDQAPQSLDISQLNSLPPGDIPDEMWWNISDGSDGKAYMMLNMYLALRGSLDFYQTGDCDRALGVIDMMKPAVGAWLGKYPDADITDDNNLMLKLRSNIQNACEQSQSEVDPTPPTDFDGGCSFS